MRLFKIWCGYEGDLASLGINIEQRSIIRLTLFQRIGDIGKAIACIGVICQSLKREPAISRDSRILCQNFDRLSKELFSNISGCTALYIICALCRRNMNTIFKIKSFVVIQRMVV